MAQLTKSNGLTYPNSGAATTTTMGLPNGVVTGLTHAPLPFPLVPGMPAGLVNGARSETGANFSIRVDGASGATAPFGGSSFGAITAYGAGFWLAAEIVDPVAFLASAASVPAAAATASTMILNQNGGGHNFKLMMDFVKGTNNPLHTSFFNLSCRNSSTDLDSDGFPEAHSQRSASGVQGWYGNGTAPQVGNLPIGRFVFVGLQFQTPSNGERRSAIINGQAVSGVGTFSASITYNAAHESGWTFTPFAVPGVRWWVVEPESWIGSDWPKSTTHFTSTPEQDLAFAYPVTYAGTELGAPWDTVDTGTVTAGVANSGPIPYRDNSSGGHTPNDRRRVTFGAGGGTRTHTLTRDIGALPFNEEGWFTIDFQNFQPRAGVQTITVKSAASATLFTITVDATTHRVTVAGPNSTTATLQFVTLANRRVTTALHLSANGLWTCSAQVPDTFTGTTSATNNTFRSAAGGRWSPTSIGRIVIANAGANTEIQEHGGVRGWRYYTLVGSDSYVHGETTGYDGSTAALAKVQLTWQNSAGPFSSVPDAHAPSCLSFYQGGPFTHIASAWGRSGHTITLGSTSVLPNMEYVRGAKIVVEGGFPNDTNTASDAATVDSVSRAMATAFGLFGAFAERTRNYLIWKQPVKGNDATMIATFTSPCFDRALTLCNRALDPYRPSGFVKTVAPYLAPSGSNAYGLAGLHPTAAEAATSALFSQTNGSNPVAPKTRFRDRRALVGRKVIV